MRSDSLFLNSLVHIDKSWNDFLTPPTVQLIKSIENKIIKQNKEFTPAANRVLHFLTLPLNEVKVIILGQDPYPQKGVATGRAFEVGTLKSWNDKFSNISLKNILRSVYFAYYNQYLKYSEIKEKIGTVFPVQSPEKLFVRWEEQGVLLLNTSFTCKTGEPNSHENLWKPFTEKLLGYIHAKNTGLIWFIWGNNARNITKDLKILRKIESMHPMMCYNKTGRAQDFLFGDVNPFYETKNVINWLG
ncbi:MAG: uracil-DNA glycosylase [Bacteroidales bacterium]